MLVISNLLQKLQGEISISQIIACADMILILHCRQVPGKNRALAILDHLSKKCLLSHTHHGASIWWLACYNAIFSFKLLLAIKIFALFFRELNHLYLHLAITNLGPMQEYLTWLSTNITPKCPLNISLALYHVGKKWQKNPTKIGFKYCPLISIIS